MSQRAPKRVPNTEPPLPLPATPHVLTHRPRIDSGRYVIVHGKPLEEAPTVPAVKTANDR